MLIRFLPPAVILLLFGSHLLAGELDTVIDPVEPSVRKWASVAIFEPKTKTFHWAHYRDSETSVDFWPASVIKLYPAVRVLERVNELNLSITTPIQFQRKKGERWISDIAVTPAKMLSEVFSRSSNEHYSLLLRACGIDEINSHFLVPAHGFKRSALMKGYCYAAPFFYDRNVPQRIIWGPGPDAVREEHTFSGKLYGKERGGYLFVPEESNISTTRDMAECLRRVMFQEILPPSERFNLSPGLLKFLREGAGEFTGLENKYHPYSWEGLKRRYPKANFYHKSGTVRGYVLDLGAIEDPVTGMRMVVALAAQCDSPAVVTKMAAAIGEWSVAFQPAKKPKQ